MPNQSNLIPTYLFICSEVTIRQNLIMTRKIQNRTARATTIAAMKARENREKLREIVREKVFEEWCKCGNCKKGNYSSICLSNKEIAKTLNTLKVPTAREKIGGWQATSVKRLFAPKV